MDPAVEQELPIMDLEVEKDLHEAALSLDEQQREYLLHLHRNSKLKPLISLGLERHKFILDLLEDKMIKDDTHDYVQYLNIRKGLLEDLMTLIKQYKLPLELNATVFAIFMVAPIGSLQNRLQILKRDLQAPDKSEDVQAFIEQCNKTATASIHAFISKGGRPPGRRTDTSPAVSTQASPSKQQHSHERAASDSNVPTTPTRPSITTRQIPSNEGQFLSPNQPAFHGRTPSLVSSQGSERSSKAAILCKERDREVCIITGLEHPEACHIFPFSGSKGNKIPNILSTLRMFWGEEAAARLTSLLGDSLVTESPRNLISLNRQIHYWYDNGFMALRPRCEHQNGTVDVQLYWLKKSSLKPSHTISDPRKIQDWVVSAGIVNPCWGDIFAHRFSGLPLETGQMFSIVPGARAEAPNTHLLQLSWYLLRVAAISGAAEYVDPSIVESDDDDENEQFKVDTQTNIYCEDDYAQGGSGEKEAEEGETPDDNGKSPL